MFKVNYFKLSIALIISVLLQFMLETNAIVCYQCSVDSVDCAEPFFSNGAGVTTCQGIYCISVVASNQYQSKGTRQCADQVAFTDCKTQQDGTVTCVCNTDLCNGYVNLKVQNTTSSLHCYSCVGNECDLPDAQKTVCTGNSCFQISSLNLATQMTIRNFGCSSSKMETKCVDGTSTNSATKTCYCNANFCNGNDGMLATTTSTTTTTTTTKTPVKQVTCYNCSGAVCTGPAMEMTQCQGTSCIEIKSFNELDELSMMRACSDTSQPTTCQTIVYEGTYATYCSCADNFCNLNMNVAVYQTPSSSSYQSIN